MKYLSKKEEIFGKANEGNLEHVLDFLDETDEEQWITEREREYLYFLALKNNFSNLVNEFDSIQKEDYSNLNRVYNSINIIYCDIEHFLKDILKEYFVNGIFIDVGDDVEENDFNEFNYNDLPKIVDDIRENFITICRDFGSAKKKDIPFVPLYKPNN